eukprot:s430_g12.t1
MSFMILKDRPESSVVVTEARDRAGGNITTMSDSNGRLWEEGPNSFQPGDAILTVACDVGLQWLGQEEDIMLADPNSYRFVWWEGSLRALPATPADAVLGNFLTWPGKIRAGLGAVGIKERCISNVVRFGEPMPEKEESVKEFVTRNLGEEVWVSVVAPLSGLQQRTTGSRNGHPVSAMSEASGQRSISEGFWSLLGRDNDAEDEVPTDAEPLEEDCPFDEEERQLLGRRRELKALLLASRQRADALASAIDAQVDEVMCQEKQRMHVIDELSQHCSDLQHAQEQRQQELLQELEKLNAATQQCSECENRSQFLVERIITLLACSPLDAEHVGVLKTKHRAEREMLRQFEDIRQQYDEVRQQNVELTSRLLEESSFSRRLSDQLAEAEERFNRCTQDGSLQSSSASREGALPEASTASATSTLHLAAPLDFPRCEVDEGPAGDSRREDAGGPAGWTPPVAPRSARARRPVGALGVLAEAEGTWLSDQKWIEALHSLCKSTPTLKCIKRDARSCKSLCIRAKEKAADFLTTRKRSRCKEFQDSQDGDSDMDEDQIDMGTLGDGDSQPIEDGAGETEEDSEGDGEDIPASQPVDTQVIDLQTPEKEWEYFQESQTPETPPTLPDPNEFSPTLADAKKELFTDAPMPPPKCLPKKYDNKIRSAASAPPEIILATPDQDTQDLGCDHLDKLADMMKQSELDSVLADDSDMPPPVLRRAQLRRKNGEDELDEGEAKDTKPMKRPASNRGRGGKGRGRGKAAKKEVEDQESARGEGEDSGPVGSIPAETEGVEDGPPEVDVPHEEETTGSGAKRKAKAKVVVKPKEKVVKPKEKVVKPKEKVAKGKEKVVKPKEKVAKGKGKAKAMSTPMKAKKKHPQDMCHSMAQRKIPAWRMRLTNDHDYDRVEYILVDETIWRKAAPVAVAPPQDSDDEAPPAPTVRSMSKADPAAPSLRGVEALSRLALPDTSDEEEEPGNKRKGKSGTVSDMSSGAEVHRIVGIGDRYPECRVPCSHAVATAKAAVNDSPNGHTRALREFASVNPKDAEDGAHQIFKKYGLTIPLPIHKTDLGAEGVEQFPILKFSDWLRYLMDNCRFSQLCGVKTVEEMMETLREFWVRFEKVYPQHEIFRRFRAGTVVPSLCLPVYSHTDEGRTYQKQGILIVSTHGALGRGTRSFIAKQVKKNHLKKPPMGMNFVGKTLSTQFLCCALLRSVYADDDTPFRKVMSYYAEDMNMLATQGVWNTPKTLRMWALHIGTKADLPALIKAGNFERTFRHVPKASSSRKPCGGICHLCLAGQEAPVHHPFEDFLPTATWTNTLFHVRPWADDNEPEIIQGLPLSREKPEDFFKLDLWHTFHAGLGKVWIGASLVCISEFGVPGNSVESKLEWINNDWHSFCRMKKICPSLKIERKTLSYPQTSAYPEGHWLWEHVPSTSLSLGCMVKAIGFTVMLPFRWQLAARNSLSVLEGALTFATNEASTDFMGSPSAIAFVIFLYA